jgi:hypothetical protein
MAIRKADSFLGVFHPDNQVFNIIAESALSANWLTIRYDTAERAARNIWLQDALVTLDEESVNEQVVREANIRALPVAIISNAPAVIAKKYLKPSSSDIVVPLYPHKEAGRLVAQWLVKLSSN